MFKSYQREKDEGESRWIQTESLKTSGEDERAAEF